MHKIKVEVFGQEILLFSSREDFNRWEKRNPIESREAFHRDLDMSEGMAGGIFTEAGDAHWFIYLTELNLKTLCHESLHLAYMLLDVVGVRHDLDNHEILAYLLDFIFGECAKKLKLPLMFEEVESP